MQQATMNITCTVWRRKACKSDVVIWTTEAFLWLSATLMAKLWQIATDELVSSR